MRYPSTVHGRRPFSSTAEQCVNVLQIFFYNVFVEFVRNVPVHVRAHHTVAHLLEQVRSVIGAPAGSGPMRLMRIEDGKIVEVCL